MEKQTLFVEVVLPLPIPGYFTYRVPDTMKHVICPGIRVVVPFGAKKIYSGLVRKITQSPPAGVQAKYIISVLDEFPLVFENQFRFWEWIAEYYMCSPGEVMNTALPAALKLAGETKVTLNPHFNKNISALSEDEFLVYDSLTIHKSLLISDISKITGRQKTLPIIANLIDKQVISLSEDIHNPYYPKKEKFIRLTQAFEPEEKLKEALDMTEKKRTRQLDVLIAYIKLSGRYQGKKQNVTAKAIKTLVNNPESPIKSLVNKGIFEYYTLGVSRFAHGCATTSGALLTDHQLSALQNIRHQLQSKDTVLLQGVTSSGKTEIYMELIHEFISKGKQVLYLLPEIALTTHIIGRIQQRFGSQAGVYHSRFNDLERTEVWNNLAFGGIESMGQKISYQLVVGPRSALFLPYSNLGLIIIDEEHDASYKQQDPAPRYNARDAATVLARFFGAKVLMGSATPSIESYYNTRTEKYGFVQLIQRYGGIQMPEIMVADLKKEARGKTAKSHLSSLLINTMTKALEEKKQVILFQNRRGFSTHLECNHCNWAAKCIQCDVSLVYHKQINKLKCHYCGYSVTPPPLCPQCGSASIFLKGFGTEKIEEEVPLFFPQATIQRLDLDTTRTKHAFQKILEDFGENKIDILIGTQMVSKGLDFENVGVVGVLSADNLLSYPDFRAYERAFQLMAQVSGRAGRKNSQGKVVIQTLVPNHLIIQQVINNDYKSMYQNQVTERRNFRYPPFYKLIVISIIHADQTLVAKSSETVAARLRQAFGKEYVLGPEYPVISKIKAQFLKNIILKLSNKTALNNKKSVLQDILKEFGRMPQWKHVRIKINVDP